MTRLSCGVSVRVLEIWPRISRWDVEARQGAIAFLGEIYKNDAEWGQEPQVKQCILDILLRLGSVSGVVVEGNVGRGVT